MDDPPTLVDVLTAPEATLLDMVLGVPGVASRVLGLHGLAALARFSPLALAEPADVTLRDAERLTAAFQLGRRLCVVRARRPRRLRTPRDTARFFQPVLGPLVHEELHIAALDSHGRVRGVRMVSRGGLESACVRVGDVMRAALEMAAVSFVMAHNHPSGDPKPSGADYDLTNAIADVGHVLGLPMEHHVIVTPGERWAVIRE